MTDWISGTCEANGMNIHYIRTGGDKPPVLLLHGLMLSGACWTPFARSLEKDYDVIMPDARGHGYSSGPEHGYNYDSLAADILDFIKVLSIDTPVLLGHSMGGMTASVVASKLSKEIQRLILVDPTFLTPQRQQEVYESDVADQHLQILNQSKEDYLAGIRVRHNHRSSELLELFAQARFQTKPQAFEILKPPNPDYRDLITTLDVPSLLVIGGIHSVVTTEIAAELAGLNQYLEIVQIMKAGHAIPYDEPDLLLSAINIFLRTE